MLAVVISDTHIGDGASNRLDDRVLEAAASADVILHAGDVTGRALLDELRGLAPVHAVLGNNDGALDQLLPVTLDVALDGVQVSMVHDAGARQGRPERLATRFPTADLVVFGHSHLPEDITAATGPRIFNPGSPTQRRRAPVRTFGLLEVTDGHIGQLVHVELP